MRQHHARRPAHVALHCPYRQSHPSLHHPAGPSPHVPKGRGRSHFDGSGPTARQVEEWGTILTYAQEGALRITKLAAYGFFVGHFIGGWLGAASGTLVMACIAIGLD